MKLSSRLQCIANMVEKCETVADIGTDHAHLPIYLIKNSISKKVIASDLRNGPARKAQKNIKESGVEDAIEVRVGNGLEVIKPMEAETIIIAGMGEKLITRILENGQNTAKACRNLILQSMTHHFELRAWLKENKYDIIDEDLCEEEGRIHLVLKVNNKVKNQDGINIYFGTILFEKNHPLLNAYIHKHIKEHEDVRNELSRVNSSKAHQKLKEFKERMELFHKFLNKV